MLILKLYLIIGFLITLLIAFKTFFKKESEWYEFFKNQPWWMQMLLLLFCTFMWPKYIYHALKGQTK